jgi:hypothetical protein
MAKIKFGQIISEARGKIAGMVFSRNKSGNFIRQKVTPLNPGSGYQIAVRTSMRTASKAWQTLTDSVRTEYETHVKDLSVRNSLGDPVRLSGYNFFVSLCRNAVTVGQAPPTTYPGNNEPAAVQSWSGASSYGPDKIILTFAPAVPAADRWVLFATKPLSKGIKSAPNEFRIIGYLSNGDLSPFDVTAMYVAKYIAIPAASKQCFFKITPVNLTSFRRMNLKSALSQSVQ